MKNYSKINLSIVIAGLILMSGLYLYQYNSDHVSANVIQDNKLPNFFDLTGNNVIVREPTSLDVNTGVTGKTQSGQLFQLYKSRSLDKFDYGKTFVVPIKG